MNNYEELIEQLGNYLSTNNNLKAIEAIKQLVAERDELRDQITEVPQIMRELTAERAECEEQARLNGMGAEREAALLAKVEMLERELAATQHVVAQYAEGERKLRDELAEANKLAADRLEQMNEDRKAYLELRDRLTDAENLLRIVASTMCATPDLQTSAKNYFRKRGIKK